MKEDKWKEWLEARIAKLYPGGITSGNALGLLAFVNPSAVEDEEVPRRSRSAKVVGAEGEDIEGEEGIGKRTRRGYAREYEDDEGGKDEGDEEEDGESGESGTGSKGKSALMNALQAVTAQV